MRNSTFGRVAILALMMGLLVPAAASAQVSFHELNLNGKVLYQDTKNNDAEDLKISSESFDSRKLGEVCRGEELEKKEKVFLVVDCEDLSVDIQIINTDKDNISFNEIIGTVVLEEDTALAKTKTRNFGKEDEETELQQVTALGAVEIECEGAELEMGGKFDVKFKDECPNTVKASKLFGTASIGGLLDIEGIIDNGRANANKPNATIAGEL